MNEAIGYTRLSQSSDTSIPRQTEHIKDYADKHNYNLQCIYDDGERSSGFDSTREEFQKVRENVSNGAVDAIVVNDKRRLARDFDATMRLILNCRENNVSIHTHQDGQLDISEPMNVAIEVVQAASDYEAKKREIEKAKEAVKDRQESGCYHGTPPLGLVFADDNCHLEKDEQEWQTVCDIIEARESGEMVINVAQEHNVSTATVSRVSNRGYEWYSERLNQYGN
jgi:DNA invertase Pin-like site-specific DNA recombinase